MDCDEKGGFTARLDKLEKANLVLSKGDKKASRYQ